MRTMLCISLLVAVLAMALPDQAVAVPNCDQVDIGFCLPESGCSRTLQWRGSCFGEEDREWRCCWSGGGCSGCASWTGCTCFGGTGCDCLLEGTPITLADGSTRPVEKIQVGDRVLAYDEFTAGMTSAEVVAVHSPYVVTHYLVVNEKVSMTENHPVLSGAKWVSTGQLQVGDMLTLAGGGQDPVYSIRRVGESARTYNFQVSMGTYVAGGIIMHNKEDCYEYYQAYPG